MVFETHKRGGGGMEAEREEASAPKGGEDGVGDSASGCEEEHDLSG